MHSMHTMTKQERDKGACAWHVHMTSQRTIEGWTRNLQRRNPGNPKRGAIRGPTWFKDTKFDHMMKFFFKCLLVYVRNRLSTVMYRLSSRFDVNANLFGRIDSKGAIKYFLGLDNLWRDLGADQVRGVVGQKKHFGCWLVHILHQGCELQKSM